MAEKIIPVNNLIEFGVIKDMPTVGLAPNTFTDTRNIRLRDGAVWKMKGDTALANSLNPTMPTNYSAGEIVYITWWNNPNLIPNNNTYYIVIVEQKLTADSSCPIQVCTVPFKSPCSKSCKNFSSTALIVIAKLISLSFSNSINYIGW